MKQNSKRGYIITSLALYFTYFIHGIGASILGQYKPEFAKAWGASVLSNGSCRIYPGINSWSYGIECSFLIWSNIWDCRMSWHGAV